MKKLVNYTILFLIILLTICMGVIIDGPASLQHYIKTILDVSTHEFSFLYFYSLIPGSAGFIVGYLTDKYFGLRVLVYLSATLLLVGSVLLSIGVFEGMFWLMITGRLVIGLGDTGLIISLNSHILLCYGGERLLSIAFAASNCVHWVGSSISFLVSNHIIQYTIKYFTPLQALGIATTCPCMSAVIFGSLCSILIHHLYGKYKQDKNEQEKNSDVSLRTGLATFIKLPLFFWVITISGLICQTSIFVVEMISQEFFMRIFNINASESSSVSSILFILVAVLSPIAGYIVDMFGRNLTFATISTLLCVTAHGIITFTSLGPYYPIVLFAVSNAMFSASFWPMLHYLVSKDQISTACGTTESLISIFMSLGIITTGYLIDTFNYSSLEWYLFILCASTCPLWIVIWKMDFNRGSLLNMSAKKRNNLEIIT